MIIKLVDLVTTHSPVQKFCSLAVVEPNGVNPRAAELVVKRIRDHARELGNEVPKKPVLFLKPTSSYIAEGQAIKVPPGCQMLHHEVEMAVIVGKEAKNIEKSAALDYVGAYALALDMTARDFQNEAKKAGLPWLLAKGFDTSCPISEPVAPERLGGDAAAVGLWLRVNGAPRQDGNTRDMVFDVPTLLEYITRFVTLHAGDVVLTGTPAGVGVVEPGDEIECALGDDVVRMRFRVAAP